MRSVSRSWVFESKGRYGLTQEAKEKLQGQKNEKEARIEELVKVWENAPDDDTRRKVRADATREANRLRKEVKALKEQLKDSPPEPISGRFFVAQLLKKLAGHAEGKARADKEFAEAAAKNAVWALDSGRCADVMINDYFANRSKAVIRRYAEWMKSGLVAKNWSHRNDDDEYDDAPGRELDDYTQLVRLTEFILDCLEDLQDDLVRSPVPSWSSSAWATAANHSKQEAKGKYLDEFGWIAYDLKRGLAHAEAYEEVLASKE